MGCNSNDVNQLTSEIGYDLYKQSVIKQYSIYELANDGCGENMKCPSNNDCIFKTRTSSRIEYYNIRKDACVCKFLTFGEDHSKEKCAVQLG